MYEIPVGKVDDTDASIYAALAREVAGETQLTTTNVLLALPSIIFITPKTTRDLPSGQENLVKRNVIQLSCIISIEGYGMEFRVNKSEHSTGGWFDAKTVQEAPMTMGMRALVLEVLEYIRAEYDHDNRDLEIVDC